VPVRTEIDRARGALLGTFVGDALGMPFEGVEPARVPEHLEMLDARRGRGTYTDDTQMAIALAESLLDHGGVDARALGRAFAGAYDPRRGYGSGTRPNATPPVLHLLTLVATRVESDPRNGSCSTRSRSRLHGFQRGRSG